MTQHRIWRYGDDVNTDVIFPGKYTYTVRKKEDMAAYALEDLDPTFAANVQLGDVIVAGKNWGCGSSREQAVVALKQAGVRAIIARSFNGLYFRNCINQGLLPIVCDLPNAQTGDILELDVQNQRLIVHGQTNTFAALSSSVQAILDAGGLVEMLKARFQPTEG
jgi:3-isopropylmalate/(R)-2-methylmalate dehydratase small subunit